jgi:HEAT repeat protein
MTDLKAQLELLKAALTVEDDFDLHRNITILGQLGGPEAGEVLIQIIKSDRKDWAKEMAAGWLGNTGGAGALECLLEAYQKDSYEMKVAAAGSLYRLGYPGPLSEMLPKVALQFENPDGAIRRDAIEELRHLASPEALPLINRALQDSNGDVRIQALRILGTGRVPDAISLLEKMTADSNPDVVAEARRQIEHLRKRTDATPK